MTSHGLEKWFDAIPVSETCIFFPYLMVTTDFAHAKQLSPVILTTGGV